MNRGEFAIFLKHLKDANDNKQDIDAIVKEHEHRNVYIYNDGCFKKIFASEKNIALTTDLINACLNLVGADRIANPRLVNPYIPGELGYKSNEPDLVLFNDRENGPRDRISLDVQHDGSKIFNDRLVLYVARHTSNMVPSGENAKLDNLNLISFQLFDAYPWKISKNYRHTVQLRNQEQQLFFEKQTITLIEVRKFLKHAQTFANDTSRLAQWLRAIDTLNREADFSEFSSDPIFRVLQNEVRLCNFSSGYLLKDGLKVTDLAYATYIGEERKAMQIARNLLAMGDSVEKICKVTGLYKKDVLELMNPPDEDDEEEDINL